MNIIYHNVPEVVSDIVQPRIEILHEILPCWVQDLIIVYDEDAPEDMEANSAAVECFYQYRYIKLHMFPAFLTDQLWKETLLHELIHMYTTPYSRRVENIVETHVPNNEIGAYLKKELLDAEEAMTQDMARLLSILTEYQ